MRVVEGAQLVGERQQNGKQEAHRLWRHSVRGEKERANSVVGVSRIIARSRFRSSPPSSLRSWEVGERGWEVLGDVLYVSRRRLNRTSSRR